jgi:hypothetical protein
MPSAVSAEIRNTILRSPIAGFLWLHQDSCDHFGLCFRLFMGSKIPDDLNGNDFLGRESEEVLLVE